MSLKSPNLDDRTFEELLAAALQHFQLEYPNAEWTDRSPSDPGMILLELFAYLTEILLYRVNQVPDKVYVELLRMLGVQLRPPTAASVTLRFSTEIPVVEPIMIPLRTPVTLSQSDGEDPPPIFLTMDEATIPAGERMVDVVAYACSYQRAEDVGTTDGHPGQTLRLQHPPLIQPIRGDDTLDTLIIGVETNDVGVDREGFIAHEGVWYRIWQDVSNFGSTQPDEYACRVDRLTGLVQFAPVLHNAQGQSQTLAAIPKKGRKVRAWYYHGGGVGGNVAANTLTILKQQIAGVSVTNPQRAVGGRPAETLENARLRAPRELHALERAVTARDYETMIAASFEDIVARSYAYAMRSVWAYAQAGTVEILLLPEVDQKPAATLQQIVAAQEAAAGRLAELDQLLEQRRALGTQHLVHWANLRPVRVVANVYCRQDVDDKEVQAKLEKQLTAHLNPYKWSFGQPVRSSHVYSILLSEPDVQYIERLTLHVDDVPDQDVRSLATDLTQPGTVYAAAMDGVYRSTNNTASWEQLIAFEGEEPFLVLPHPEQAGMVAVVTRSEDRSIVRIHFSTDCGETWRDPASASSLVDLPVYDATWLVRDGHSLLLLATEGGLFEVSPETGRTPQTILVDRFNQDRGFYAVAVYTDAAGVVHVAVAAMERAGVYLSQSAGRRNTFVQLRVGDGSGLIGEEIRHLAFQQVDNQAYLWAGTASRGGDVGRGCFRWDISMGTRSVRDWEHFSEGWDGGTCMGLAFHGTRVYAASHRSGILSLNADPSAPTDSESSLWQSGTIRSGLPLRAEGTYEGKFELITGVGILPDETLLVSCSEGIFRSKQPITPGGSESPDLDYETATRRIFAEEVTIPPTWVVVSSEHTITVNTIR